MASGSGGPANTAAYAGTEDRRMWPKERFDGTKQHQWWDRDPTYSAWKGVGGLSGDAPPPRAPEAAKPKGDKAGPENPFKNKNPWHMSRGCETGLVQRPNPYQKMYNYEPQRPIRRSRSRSRDRSRDRDRRRRRSRSRSRSRERRDPARAKPAAAAAAAAAGPDPFLGAAPPPAKKADPFADPAGWEREREKLGQWEKTGAIPEEKLGHLSKFLGKDAEPHAENALRAAEAAKIAEAEQIKRQLADLTVPKPAFAEANHADLQCDGCKVKQPRHKFTREQLLKMNDADREPGNKAGPWRGRVVRVQAFKHFGFIYSDVLVKELAVKQRNVFLHAKWIEKLLGGHAKIRKCLDEGQEEFCRVEFTIEFGKDLIEGEPKMYATEVEKLDVLCKPCEEKFVQAEDEKKEMRAKLSEAEKRVDSDGVAKSRNEFFRRYRGLDEWNRAIPEGKAAIVGPQMPGARGAAPLRVDKLQASEAAKSFRGLGTAPVVKGFDPKAKLAGLLGTLGNIKGSQPDGPAPKTPRPALPPLP